MRWEEIRLEEDRNVLDVYPRRNIAIVRGKGNKVYDAEGREYIDCATGVGVAALGYGNERVAEAIHEQYMKLCSCYGIFYNDRRAELAKKLVSLAPGMRRAFFCNSGSESIEAAIKFARASTGRKKIVCAMRGFHGKTMGALSATWDTEYRNPFLPLVDGFVHVPFNNPGKLEEAVDNGTAAVLLEIIQGEGGVRAADPGFLAAAGKACGEHGCLLIIDEVQTFARTGQLFAYENLVSPDIVCIAKALGGGMPIGAVLCNGKINIPKKSHTSTFGGNPIACAAALATLEVMESGRLVGKAGELGTYILQKLTAMQSPLVKEVRGRGLMIGIELHEKAGPYVQEMMAKGLIVLLAGNFVVRLLPPLTITREDADRVLEIIREVLHAA